MYTENISRNGLLLAWRGEHGALPVPSVGQIVTVEVELPAHHNFGQKCIHCQGIVTRVTGAAGECPLVALRLNYMDFRSFHDRIRSLKPVHPLANSWMA
jgi:hypothetical protein